ncbi:MAG: amino acid ABC transporter permease [Bacillota bacterium]
MNFNIKYFLKSFIVIGKALPITLSVAIISMLFGLVIGLVVTFIRNSKIPIVKNIFETYVSFFRGTPLMVQLFIFFYGLPQILPVFSKMNAFSASIIVMSINGSAYISEIMRSSINSISDTQLEAALSMGMSEYQAMERIVLPQAFKVAIPPLGNTFINLIQGTSLTFMLGLKDIMGVAKMTAASSYRFFETYMAVGIIYWIVTLLSSKATNYLERKLNYGK